MSGGGSNVMPHSRLSVRTGGSSIREIDISVTEVEAENRRRATDREHTHTHAHTHVVRVTAGTDADERAEPDMLRRVHSS